MRKVELMSGEGVEALSTCRSLKCELNDEEFKEMLDWVNRRDEKQSGGNSHLSIVDKEK